MSINILQCLNNTDLLIAERINHVLDLLKYPRDVAKRTNLLAEHCQMPQHDAYTWLSGLSEPDERILDGIAHEFIINSQWLKSGIGKPIAGKHTKTGMISLPQFPLSLAWDFKNLINDRIIRNRVAVADDNYGPRTFAVYVGKEHLNTPLFERDSHFMIDPDAIIDEGDIVFIKTGNTQQIICGRYVEADEARVIAPLDQTKPHVITELDRIIGPTMTVLTHYKTY